MSLFVPTILTYPEGVHLDPTRRLLVEIGPGRGDFLFHLAKENPATQVVGIEIKRKRFEKLKPRIEKLGLTNILLFCGDAREVVPRYFPDQSVEQCYILFSDPWPKKRHAKHRLFQEPFLQEVSRILKKEGILFVAHDDPIYQKQIHEETSKITSLKLSEGGVGLPGSGSPGSGFPTFYAEKWRKEGRTLSSFFYQKI